MELRGAPVTNPTADYLDSPEVPFCYLRQLREVDRIAAVKGRGRPVSVTWHGARRGLSPAEILDSRQMTSDRRGSFG